MIVDHASAMMHIPCLVQPQLAVLAESHSLKFQKNPYHEGIIADSQILDLIWTNLWIHSDLSSVEHLATLYCMWEWAARSVVLNRGYTYHLGMRGAKAGGTKHQSLQGYKLWKFEPDFIEHSSWFSVVWRTIIHSLGLVRYTLWKLYLACLHSKSAVA